ncbi:MAG: hypothetical protein E3K37_01440 [Candidatus Kuenenia sp.]|nr:hypothetical protein [Candidatus Kuenenia hertensis]
MLSTMQVELFLARHFNTRVNMLVPNVSWGMGFRYEIDLLLIRPSGYMVEFEIKVAKNDLIADKKKGHFHKNNKIRELYFAIPEYLEPYTSHIQPDAGIYLIGMKGEVKLLRKADIKSDYKITDNDKIHLGKLCSMRIWNLKESVYSSSKAYKNLLEEIR